MIANCLSATSVDELGEIFNFWADKKIQSLHQQQEMTMCFSQYNCCPFLLKDILIQEVMLGQIHKINSSANIP